MIRPCIARLMAGPNLSIPTTWPAVAAYIAGKVETDTASARPFLNQTLMV